MSKHSEAIARAVLRVFRQQSHSGGERFGNWTGRMADALIKPLLEAYQSYLRRMGAKDDDWAEAVSQMQAREAAIQVNQGTTDMLERGREYREVFSSDRAALIGVDQNDKAHGACQVRAAEGKGEVLVWECGAKPCKTCVKLNGRVRKPGKAFAIVHGEPVFHAPLHPNCNCKTRTQRAS